MDIFWLVVWNIFYFPINIGCLIIPIDFHIFQRGGPTTNQIGSGNFKVARSGGSNDSWIFRCVVSGHLRATFSNIHRPYGLLFHQNFTDAFDGFLWKNQESHISFSISQWPAMAFSQWIIIWIHPLDPPFGSLGLATDGCQENTVVMKPSEVRDGKLWSE